MSSESGVLNRVESTRREMEDEDSKGTKGVLVEIQGAYNGLEEG